MVLFDIWVQNGILLYSHVSWVSLSALREKNAIYLCFYGLSISGQNFSYHADEIIILTELYSLPMRKQLWLESNKFLFIGLLLVLTGCQIVD